MTILRSSGGVQHNALSDRAVARAEPATLHDRLAKFNHIRLSAALPSSDVAEGLAEEFDQRRLECAFVDRERRAVASRAAEAPRDAARFTGWFEALKVDGPGQGDPLFSWLAESASLEEMRWFVKQEAAGEAGFEDLTALAQLKLPPRPKLEMARNYWDEMGRGNEKGMHGPMLTALVRALGVENLHVPLVWESLALGNLMMALAVNRCYAFHAIGALGAIELTAPTRAVHVARGLKRLGVARAARHYFALHSTLDLQHSESWNREVLAPLVAEMPAVATAIAEGALLRLAAGARCFARYRTHLWTPPRPARLLRPDRTRVSSGSRS